MRATAAGRGLERKPVVFRGCSGHLHISDTGSSSDLAFVMCPGIGRDGNTGYRALRVIADRLAEAGVPALRFSYRGTGDSDDVAQQRVADWLQDVRDAIDETVARTGVRRIVLLGLRMGATLAALAAAEHPLVAGLVLIEPVTRGRAFATQLRMEERLSKPSDAGSAADIRVHGLCLTPAETETIAEIDLRSLRLPPHQQVLALSAQQALPLREAVEAWQRRGLSITHYLEPEVSAFLRPTHLADEPLPVLQALWPWITQSFPLDPQSARLPARGSQPVLYGSGWRETAYRFGRSTELFGILCAPSGSCPSDDKIVIIGNTGGDPHQGFARSGVEIARHLARRGLASLRMDFAGLGDSIDPSGDMEAVTHTFSVDRTEDFRAAVDFVRSLGFSAIAVQGLCSGAYHAFQAAVMDPRISSVFCINLPFVSLRYERAGPESFARRAVMDLAARGAATSLIYAPGDPGLASLRKQFGATDENFVIGRGVDMTVLDDIDHDLTRPEMRRRIAERLICFIAAPPPIPVAAAGSAGDQPVVSRTPAGIEQGFVTEGAS